MIGQRRQWALLAAAALTLAFFLGPLGFQVVTSVRPADAPMRGWPSHLSLDSYRSLFQDTVFFRAILNSFVVAATTTVFCLSVGASAAFALAQLEFPGRQWVLSFALAVSMFPPIATVSPLYLMLRAVGLRDQLMGLVLPYTSFALPMSLWLLTSYFRQLPRELYLAARVDGCTPFQAYWRVQLPLAAPGLVTTGLLVFILAWNEFLFALTFLSSPQRRTVPVALSLFTTEHKEPFSEIAAASLVATLPLVVLTVMFQRRIVAGLTAGAVKE